MNSNKENLIVAIDGYSSTGKSTYAKLIAKKLNYIYVDSGAMYRAVTLHCMEQGLFDNSDAPDVSLVVNELDNINIHFQRNPETEQNETCLGDRVVEKEIRTMAVSGHVSYISTIAEVREKMVALQRKIGTTGGVVMDGRDIGTVVYPHAQIKIFMTAGAEVRAERRRLELVEKGIADDFEKVFENIKKRDRIDSGREVSPLRQAEDAILLDNSLMTIEGQIEWFYKTFSNILDGDKTN
ncbi:MAG: (d)CMP kinase [Bacteroidales bacterium]|jgi:cytidylate kinase|nr:(d)CMP kinase [Bacteroidales bacterium]